MILKKLSGICTTAVMLLKTSVYVFVYYDILSN